MSRPYTVGITYKDNPRKTDLFLSNLPERVCYPALCIDPYRPTRATMGCAHTTPADGVVEPMPRQDVAGACKADREHTTPSRKLPHGESFHNVNPMVDATRNHDTGTANRELPVGIEAKEGPIEDETRASGRCGEGGCRSLDPTLRSGSGGGSTPTRLTAVGRTGGTMEFANPLHSRVRRARTAPDTCSPPSAAPPRGVKCLTRSGTSRLRSTLETEVGRVGFLSHLQREYSEGSLLFYEACEAFKARGHSLDTALEGRRILDTYIKESGTDSVNISCAQRAVIEAAFAESAREGTAVPSDVFDVASRSVYQLMGRDNHARYGGGGGDGGNEVGLGRGRAKSTGARSTTLHSRAASMHGTYVSTRRLDAERTHSLGEEGLARATTYPPPVVQGVGGAPLARNRMRKTQSVSMGVLFKTAGSRIRKAQSAVGLFKTAGSGKSDEALFKIKEAKRERVLQKALKKEEKKTKKAEVKAAKIDA